MISLEMWLVVSILAVAIFLFITEWLRVDLVALGVLLALAMSGILTVQEAFAGFSNTAVLTIMFLFVVGGAVWQTGLAATIGQGVLRVAGTELNRLLIVLVGTVALLSGFMSNTGTVAVLMPAIIVLARKAGIHPAKLLIPLSFGSMFGGAATLIGTPPNLVINDALAEQGLSVFGFFSFLPMGLAMTGLGVLYILTVGKRLLPATEPTEANEQLESSQELVKRYQLPEQLRRLRILPGSPLGQTNLGDAHLHGEFGVTVLRIMRPPLEPYAFSLAGLAHNPRDHHRVRDLPILPERSTRFQEGDALIVEGNTEQIRAAAQRWNCRVEPPKPKDAKALVGKDTGVAEVVIPSSSKLIGQTLLSSRFGDMYRLWVLELRRPGVTERLHSKTTPLQFGDVLLVQGLWEKILALRNFRRDFIVLGEPEADMGAPRRHRSSLALLVLITMVGLMVWGGLPVVVVTLLAALAMVLLGCLPLDELYKSIDWKSVVLIAGMLPMSTAMEKVGLVEVVAEGLVTWLGVYSPRAVMVGLFVLTAIFTQFISNTATTVVVAPIALAASLSLGVTPQAFLMTVAVAASAAFATPVASPTNTLVMGAGGYSFRDYAKVGLPLILLTLVLAVILLPMLFPL